LKRQLAKKLFLSPDAAPEKKVLLPAGIQSLQPIQYCAIKARRDKLPRPLPNGERCHGSQMGLEYLIMNSNQKNAIPCYQGSFL
jgi:hypothetical protein